MPIYLPSPIEALIRQLADRQGRPVESVVEEAIRQYLDATAITDIAPDDVARTQESLLPELTIEPWDAGGGSGDAAR